MEKLLLMCSLYQQILVELVVIHSILSASNETQIRIFKAHFRIKTSVCWPDDGCIFYSLSSTTCVINNKHVNEKNKP